MKNGLTIYTYNVSIGANEYRESTWFNGYNEKFFYDKGALFAAIFKKFGHFLCCLVLLKNKKLLFGNSINYKKAVSLAKAGAKGFYNGITYEKWISGDN